MPASSKPKAKSNGRNGKRSKEDVAGVVSPDYYASRAGGAYEGLQCFDAQIMCLGEKGFKDYCVGCIIKYIWRYREKGGKADLAKAADYLDTITQMMDYMEENDA